MGKMNGYHNRVLSGDSYDDIDMCLSCVMPSCSNCIEPSHRTGKAYQINMERTCRPIQKKEPKENKSKQLSQAYKELTKGLGKEDAEKVGCIVEYLMRFRDTRDIDELRKIRRFVDRMIRKAAT